ncbi:MAG: hypothetical protein ACTHJ0_02590 [Flavipsychrobacter sp.]
MEVFFRTVKTADDKTQFIAGNITITVSDYTYYEGRHQIADPRSATAQYIHAGQTYECSNKEGYFTVEDWYAHELYPKFIGVNIAA